MIIRADVNREGVLYLLDRIRVALRVAGPYVKMNRADLMRLERILAEITKEETA